MYLFHSELKLSVLLDAIWQYFVDATLVVASATPLDSDWVLLLPPMKILGGGGCVLVGTYRLAIALFVIMAQLPYLWTRAM